MPTVTISLGHVKRIVAADEEAMQVLEDRIDRISADILDADSKQEALETALTLDYLIVRLRAKINVSLTRLRELQQQDIQETAKAFLKQRESGLVQRSLRLTELREDMSSLQKLAYTVRGTFS